MKSLQQHIAESLAEENQTNVIAESKLVDENHVNESTENKENEE